jgi:hypothetical protein
MDGWMDVLTNMGELVHEVAVVDAVLGCRDVDALDPQL